MFDCPWLMLVRMKNGSRFCSLKLLNHSSFHSAVAMEISRDFLGLLMRHGTTPHAARMLPDSSMPVSIASSSPVILMIADSKTADGGLNVLYKD